MFSILGTARSKPNLKPLENIPNAVIETLILLPFQNAGKPRRRIPHTLGEPQGSECSPIARKHGKHTPFIARVFLVDTLAASVSIPFLFLHFLLLFLLFTLSLRTY